MALRWFRFVRAIGGHANDFDRLTVALRCGDRTDLLALLGALGLPALVHEEVPPQPEVGRSYPATEFGQFVSLVGRPAERPIIQQPSRSLLQGEQVFAWVHRDGAGWRLEIDVVDPGGSYEVTKESHAAAARLERVLEAFRDRIV